MGPSVLSSESQQELLGNVRSKDQIAAGREQTLLFVCL